jgi:hypothetical protein
MHLMPLAGQENLMPSAKLKTSGFPAEALFLYITSLMCYSVTFRYSSSSCRSKALQLY